MLFEIAKDQNRWEQLRTSGTYAELRACLQEKKEMLDAQLLPAEDYQAFRQYADCGERVTYEGQYFQRRTRLAVYALWWLLWQEEDALHKLESVIWAICGEFTWALPAHIDGLPLEQQRTCVDLFSAETSFALAEICHLLSDVLSPLVMARVKDEVERRVFQPYLSQTFWWETKEMNWSSVCAGGVGAAVLYLFPERFGLVQDRLLKSMGCFLQGVGSDGICREGLDYWKLGFGYYIYFADLLFQFTDGTIDLFADSRVKAAASYQQNAFLQGSCIASFSDCSTTGTVAAGLARYLQEKFPDEPIVPCGAPLDNPLAGEVCQWIPTIRDLLWRVGLDDCAAVIPAVRYCKQAQWYLVKRQQYALAAKGGNNNEPHNHNDIGSFVLAVNGKPLLCDVGSGEYCRAYFKQDTRYDFFVTSSRSHCVPLIADTPQKAGANCQAMVLRADETAFTLEFANAYPVAGLQRVERSFIPHDNGISIHDTVCWNGDMPTLKERFVSFIQPVKVGKLVRIGNVTLRTESPTNACKITVHRYRAHDGKDTMCYITEFFVVQTAEGHAEFELEIEIEKEVECDECTRTFEKNVIV